MKLHIITVGKPKLKYARLGWDEYIGRLEKMHTTRVTHAGDKFADDAIKLLSLADYRSYTIALVIEAAQCDSLELARLLREQELEGKELTFFIGGPDGLPAALIDACERSLSLSKLTLPHDLAMVVLAEALYRACTILKQLPYHHS